MQGKVNVLAVVAAAIVHFLLGAVWFTLLGNAWLRGIGKTKEQLNPTALPYVVAFVCNLLLAYALAWVIARAGEQSVRSGSRRSTAP